MKKMLFLMVLLVCVELSWAQEPLEADAGRDSVFCFAVPDSFVLGGSPAALGGSGNYSYKWDMYPKPYIPFPSAPSLKYYASDYLLDTTSSNPLLIRTFPHNMRGPLDFVLEIIDDSNNVDTDTVKFWSIKWTISAGSIMLFVNPGDTQIITPKGFEGGFPPYTFDWGDSPNLLGERYDFGVYPDSFLPARQVIVPDGPSPFWNSLIVTDSLGCAEHIGTSEGFLIEPLSVNEIQNKIVTTWSIYDKKVSINAVKPIKEISVFNIIGQDVPFSINSSHDKSLEIHVENPGIYFIQLKYSTSKETIKILRP